MNAVVMDAFLNVNTVFHEKCIYETLTENTFDIEVITSLWKTSIITKFHKNDEILFVICQIFVQSLFSQVCLHPLKK